MKRFVLRFGIRVYNVHVLYSGILEILLLSFGVEVNTEQM